MRTSNKKIVDIVKNVLGGLVEFDNQDFYNLKKDLQRWSSLKNGQVDQILNFDAGNKFIRGLKQVAIQKKP